MKWICILMLFLSSLFVWGQKENVLPISTQCLTSLNLSDIADKSAIISLNEKPNQYQFIWFTKQYLYLAGINNDVYQYHISGQYIRSFKCGGHILGFTGDEAKRELYIPVSKNEKCVLECYDYFGNLLRKFPLEHAVSSCVHFENEVWMVQNFIRADTVCYELSKLDCMNGDISKLGVFYKDYYWPGFSIICKASFSQVNGRLYFSVNTDSTLYQVRGDRFEPYLRWHINPEKRFLSERGVLDSHILSGCYLFVKYSRNDPDDSEGKSCKDYLYVKSIKGSPVEYNVQYVGNALKRSAGMVDDLYHTGYVGLLMSNKPNCFYFTAEQKNKKSGKREFRIYLVRVKQ